MPWRPSLPGLFCRAGSFICPTIPQKIRSCKAPPRPSRWAASESLVVAHIVDTHSCRPGSRLSHKILFTGRSAQSVARWAGCPISHLLRANGGRAGARISVSFLRRLFGVRALPMPQPFPTDFRQFSGNRHTGDLCARSLPHPRVKVFQGCISWIAFIAAWTKTHRSQGDPCRVIEPW